MTMIDFTLLNLVNEGYVNRVLVKKDSSGLYIEMEQNENHRFVALSVSDCMTLITIKGDNVTNPLVVRVCKLITGAQLSTEMLMLIKGIQADPDDLCELALLKPCLTQSYKDEVGIVDEFWVCTGEVFVGDKSDKNYN